MSEARVEIGERVVLLTLAGEQNVTGYIPEDNELMDAIDGCVWVEHVNITGVIPVGMPGELTDEEACVRVLAGYKKVCEAQDEQCEHEYNNDDPAPYASCLKCGERRT